MVKKEDDKPPTTATTTTKKTKPSRSLHSPPSSKLNQINKSPPNSKFNSKTPNSLSNNSTIRRSTRRNPIIDQSDEDVEEEEEDEEEEDERELKKQKLVQRLKSHPADNAQNSRSSEVPQSRSNGVKVEAIVDRVSGSVIKDGAGNVSRVTDAACRVLDEVSESTTPLPDKKIILFILGRLQKKDTHGVFSEPVDPEELPDYHEIIQNPMDFSNVRRKLDDELYQNLEQFEDDIFLICSNAMQYNSPSTVFFRKARAIQELAKRDFDNLRQKGEDGKPQPRVIRRGRPPRTVEKSPELVARQDFNSESPIAHGSVFENSKTYNLRKGLSSSKFVSDDFMGTNEPSSNGASVGLLEWNTEFPASILRAPYGKKPVIVDETRRDTYRQPIASHEFPATNMLMSEQKKLLPVGLGVTEHYGYPSSVARFATGLGPVAWKIAGKKIEQSLSPGIEFDPLQFAYESPKFRSYELDSNLMPIFRNADKSNSNPTQSPPVVNHEESTDSVGVPRPQNSMTRVNGTTVGVAVNPAGLLHTNLKYLDPNRSNRSV